ncbi:MAG: hypothetical protein PHE67_01760 [Campylobacterales bacterium]|nr:hypothetical protein [Campylobacterales bacterium]
MLKVAIFTEAGSEYGYGHLSRCSALKQGFDDSGAATHMYVRGDAVQKSHFQKKEWLECFESIVNDGFDVIVIDSYHAKENVYQYAEKHSRLGVWFDDTNRIEYPHGYVIIGKNTVMLRKAFWDRTIDRPLSDNRIFISFGGMDCEKYINELLPILRKKKNEYSFVFASKIPREMLGANDVLIENLDSNLLVEYMAKCSLAISAGGQTMLELSALGIPTVAVIIADNQRESVTKCAENKNILGFVDVKNPDWALKAVDLLGSHKNILPITIQTKQIVNDILGKLQGI